MKNPRPTRLPSPLAVIVPIFNGLDCLMKLVESLSQSFPRKLSSLTFIIIDDSSTDPGVATFLSGEKFFTRSDVTVERNPANLGFTATVNRAISMADPACDVLLLNTDTEVHGNVPGILQDVAYRHGNVASVTPLTNNGTIASLGNWPEGGEIPFDLSASDAAQLVEAAAIPTPYYNAPTGIGFCMYMTRRAIEAVGVLDEEGFAKGYGEENDWCQKAVKAGFTNLICTEAFVYHQGGQSFTSAQKRKQSKQGFGVLKQRHPAYLFDVERMICSDPLASTRAALLWQFRKAAKAKSNLRTVTIILHNDPDHPRAGTERHVNTVSHQLVAEGHSEVIQVFPIGEDRYRVRCATAKPQPEFDFVFEKHTFAPVLAEILKESDVLHVHSVVRIDRHVQKIVEQAHVGRKIFTAHDFTVVCPSMHLNGASGAYCGLPSSAAKCNRCLRSHHNYAEEPMASYRARMIGFLASFDIIIVPSSAAREILLAGLKALGGNSATVAGELAGKVQVLAHFIPVSADKLAARRVVNRSAGDSKLLVLLGFIAPHKGGSLLLSTMNQLYKMGYRIEIWGVFPVPEQLQARVKVRPYESISELGRRFRKEQPHMVCIPSVVPETYSYTMFEALLLSRAPVVVGPFGNPADVVRTLGVGQVMESASPRHFVAAIKQAETNYNIHLECIEKHWPDLAAQANASAYFYQLEQVYKTDSTKPGALQDKSIADFSSAMPVHHAQRISGTDQVSLPQEHAWLAQYAPLLTRLKFRINRFPRLKRVAAFIFRRLI